MNMEKVKQRLQSIFSAEDRYYLDLKIGYKVPRYFGRGTVFKPYRISRAKVKGKYVFTAWTPDGVALGYSDTPEVLIGKCKKNFKLHEYTRKLQAK